MSAITKDIESNVRNHIELITTIGEQDFIINKLTLHDNKTMKDAIAQRISLGNIIIGMASVGLEDLTTPVPTRVSTPASTSGRWTSKTNPIVVDKDGYTQVTNKRSPKQTPQTPPKVNPDDIVKDGDHWSFRENNILKETFIFCPRDFVTARVTNTCVELGDLDIYFSGDEMFTTTRKQIRKTIFVFGGDQKVYSWSKHENLIYKLVDNENNHITFTPCHDAPKLSECVAFTDAEKLQHGFKL